MKQPAAANPSKSNPSQSNTSPSELPEISVATQIVMAKVAEDALKVRKFLIGVVKVLEDDTEVQAAYRDSCRNCPSRSFDGLRIGFSKIRGTPTGRTEVSTWEEAKQLLSEQFTFEKIDAETTQGNLANILSSVDLRSPEQ